jgi:hypothetical protein
MPVRRMYSLKSPAVNWGPLSSRVSGETQALPFRAPQAPSYGDALLGDLCQHRVLPGDAGLEHLDLLLQRLHARPVVLECLFEFLEGLFLPAVEEARLDAGLLADLGHWDLLHVVPTEDGGTLFAAERRAGLAGHGLSGVAFPTGRS